MSPQFRVELFTRLDHMRFSNPTGNFDSGRFGLVGGARSLRIAQLRLKFLWQVLWGGSRSASDRGGYAWAATG
jgi:hypothetical protein